ncbi:MAG: polyhydroxybutyrate depolymerase [bacterium]|nr:polyhydroxybutyrate depolymerase [bacterium]
MIGAILAATLVASRLEHLTIGGLDRSYRVFRPANLARDRAVPLVVMLHGGFGSAEQAEKDYGWDAAATRHGFVVVYPNGERRAWNAGTCCGTPQRDGVDDVAFISTVIRTVEAHEHIDPSRIAVTGMSNGAMMAYRMACEANVPLHAIGSVAGTMLVPCAHPQRLSVVEIHGLADRNVPFAGGTGEGPGHVVTPPIPGVLARWMRSDACAPAAQSQSGVVRREYASCADGTSVEMITVANAGHQWPGSHKPPGRAALLARLFGIHGLDAPSTAFDATELLYRFFFAP